MACLLLQDMFLAAVPSPDSLFDSLVMSEILEHLEEPVAALRAARRVLRSGGLLFVNVRDHRGTGIPNVRGQPGAGAQAQTCSVLCRGRTKGWLGLTRSRQTL